MEVDNYGRAGSEGEAGAKAEAARFSERGRNKVAGDSEKDGRGPQKSCKSSSSSSTSFSCSAEREKGGGGSGVRLLRKGRRSKFPLCYSFYSPAVINFEAGLPRPPPPLPPVSRVFPGVVLLPRVGASGEEDGRDRIHISFGGGPGGGGKGESVPPR